MTLDQPSHHVLELSDETLWPDQPLGRSIAGNERSLNRTRRSERARLPHTPLCQWIHSLGRCR
ncbi:MAG: hypothetical protein Ct9H300mP32_1350 [Verrucomicrobiota bacterium]|nr:MAG: hypothetical protein Ct9H300mP32_1350 [Verrucomicrobiota bacterium]